MFFVLDHNPCAISVICDFRKLIVLIALVFLDLSVILEVSLHKVRDGSDICPYGRVLTLLVVLFVNRKDNHVDIVANGKSEKEKEQAVSFPEPYLRT